MVFGFLQFIGLGGGCIGLCAAGCRRGVWSLGLCHLFSVFNLKVLFLDAM